MYRQIIFFLIFLLPFLVNLVSGAFFEVPKVIAAEIAIEVLLALFFLKNQNLFKSISRLELVLIGLFFLLTIIQLISGKISNIFGNEFRLQGLFLFWHLLILFFLSKRLYINFSNYFYLIALILITGSSFLFNTVSGRAIGTLGEPNALAASALFFFPFIFLSKNQTLYKYYAFLTTIVVIIFSGSRSALLAFMLLIIFSYLLKKVKLHLSTIAVFLVILVSLILPFIEGGGWYENRAEIWQTALIAGLRYPFTGWGFGNIELALNEQANLLGNNVKYQYVDSSHNFLLDFFIQGGLVGLGLILTIIFISIKSLIFQKRVLELGALIVLITVMLFNPVSVVTLVAFWYVLGQSFSKL